MKKAILFLVYEHTDDMRSIKVIYKDLQRFKLQENEAIYLLKLSPKSRNGEKFDEIFKKDDEAVSDFPGFVRLEEATYDFKQYQDLLFGLKRFQEANKDAKKYLIVQGHGMGFGFFRTQPGHADDDFNDLVLQVNDNFFISYAIDLSHKYFSTGGIAVLYDVLWNHEFSKAIHKVDKLYFELALFNTCATMLLDNCFLFADKVKYLIGSQNYLTTDFLPIPIILKNIRESNGDDDLKFSKSVFDSYVENAELIGRGRRVLALKEASLSLVQLRDFRYVLKRLNEILRRLIEHHMDDVAWILNMRERLWLIGSGYDYVDLCMFLDEINSLAKTELNDNGLVFATEKLKEYVGKVVQSTWIYTGPPRRAIAHYNGINIFFPDQKILMDSSLMPYRDIYSDYFIGKSNWDDFLKKLARKLKNKPSDE